jgi:hypothetical protein|tara:strand:- start:5989 stop:6711 length:723 start_codon:yes stop_codon:yes gene_type:complete
MIVIPMAGKSSRFFDAGYDLPKFMLPLGASSTLFEESVKSFDRYFDSDIFIFIVREEHLRYDFIEQKCIDLGIKTFEIISLFEDTNGQADTVYLGLEKLGLLNSQEEIYIFNIDSIRKNFIKPGEIFLKNTYGYLEVFIDQGHHWSFIEPMDSLYVKRTTEKVKVSDLCSNGLYYFKSVDLFSRTFMDCSITNEFKELFVAPMYNILIEQNKPVKYLLLEDKETLFAGIPLEYEELKNKY